MHRRTFHTLTHTEPGVLPETEHPPTGPVAITSRGHGAFFQTNRQGRR